MLKRKEIYQAHRKNKALTISTHARNSSDILSRASKQLDKYPSILSYKLDKNWPFHLIVFLKNRQLSVYSGGWTNQIEICPLSHKGIPVDNSTVILLTPEGAVNYIVRTYEH